MVPGYTNASWTLRADMTARAFAKLVAYMDSHGYTHAYPHLGDVPMDEKKTFDLDAGYILTCQSHPTSPTVSVDYDA